MIDWRSHTTLFHIRVGVSFLLDVSAVTLNGLIAYVLKKYKKTNVLTFWYIYCLSVSDIMVGITGLILHSLLLNLCHDPAKASCNLLHNIAGEFHGYFVMTSWMLILIIAIDRCFHMNFPQKYGLIAKLRARLTVIFILIFGMIMEIPRMLSSNAASIWFRFARDLLFALGTAVIFAIYLLSYFLIKRKVNALQARKLDNSPVQNVLDKGIESQNIAPVLHHCNDSAENETGKRIKSAKVPYAHNLNTIKAENSVVEECLAAGRETDQRQQKCMSQCMVSYSLKCNDFAKGDKSRDIGITKEYTFPKSHANEAHHDDIQEPVYNLRHSTSGGRNFMKMKNIKSNDTKLMGPDLDVVSIALQPPTIEEVESHENELQSKHPIRKLVVGGDGGGALLGRQTKPEEEFRKATCLILLAVFFCYCPTLINFFHKFATRDNNAALSFISGTSLLLNSSLNAVILIVCSRDVYAKVKTLFTKG